MLPPQHLESVARSREEILRAVGDASDLVLVRTLGNLGDALSWAGARALLGDLDYREIDVDELPGVRGHTALICGGGGFCHPYHELMPHVLAVAEMRFERVVLLPSSFDTSVDAVRDALESTRAVVFARERESYSQIQSLCDARLAHDCAFFFDYGPYRKAGSGVLLALRTDHESTRERSIPLENDDISATSGTLERFLERISSHELIQTDRAHVMIAAALLGKTVEFDSGSYFFEVPAIADYALNGFPVKRLPAAAVPEWAPVCLAPSPCSAQAEAVRERLRARAESNPPPPIERVRDSAGSPRVTAVIISHNRPDLVLGTLHSLIHVTSIPVNIVVVDNNSTARTSRTLTETCAEHPQIRLHLSERNLGAAAGRELALGLVDTEFVFFLDDDIELLPGAIEHLVSILDLHPDIGGVTPLVVLPDGRVSHSGGRYEISREIVSFTPVAAGIQFDDPDIPESGPCDWIQVSSLVRMSLLAEFPLDTGMSNYYEDNEWCFRVARSRSGCFRRSREAIILHHAEHKPWGRKDFIGRAYLVRFIALAAYFYSAHGLLLGCPGLDVFTIMPELTRTNETLDLAGARLIMELASTHSDDWLLMEWMNGGLDPVLGIERTELGDELDSSRREADTLRAELAVASSNAEDARRKLESQCRAHEETVAGLQRIYESRLWKLGGYYDRVRRRARQYLPK
jgi:GT2 family glycosyltransferase